MDNRAIENRPAYQFILTIKNIIKESEPVLKANSWHYRTARIKLDILKTSLQDIERSILKSEEVRPFFKEEDLLSKNCLASAERVNELTTMLAEIKDDSARERWESEMAKIASLLHFKQMEMVQTNDIDTFRTLRIADKKLLQLKENAKKARVCCVPTKRQRAFEDQVEKQEAVIANLELSLDHHKSDPEIEKLQKQYNELRVEVQYQLEHKDDIIRQAANNLENAKMAHSIAVDKINAAKAAYYADLSPQDMHGLLRVYERFRLFATAYQSNIKNKDEAIVYLAKINDTQAKLDAIFTQLWCSQFGKTTAKDFYWQFKKLTDAEKEKLLVQLPDAKIFSQSFSNRTESTAEKRAYLKRNNEGVNGKVIFKI